MKKKALLPECASGISGDMMLGALLDMGADREGLMHLIGSLPIDGYRIHQGETKKKGIRASYFHVDLYEEHKDKDHDLEEYEHHHHDHEPGVHSHMHRTMEEIRPILEQMEAADEVKKMAFGIFGIIADAEAKAHGIPVGEVHFHEVGAVDSLIDIVGVSYCCWSLGITEAYVSPLSEGFGHVRCAHGFLPVPVPAVQNILIASGLPMRRVQVEGELVTPTGAAIAAWLWNRRTLPDTYRLLGTGIGAGEKEFPQANVLRANMIEVNEEETDPLWVLETNMDDVTGEALGYTLEKLLEAGARDAYYQPVYMKKNRPGYLLHVLCAEEQRSCMEELIFRHTTTIGIRRYPVQRTCMNREIVTRETPWGDVRMKRCSIGGIRRDYPEYEDVRRICEKQNAGFTEVYRALAGEKKEEN